MKIQAALFALAAATIASHAHAQNTQSGGIGPGSTTGDPAASSASQSTVNPSNRGSGTSGSAVWTPTATAAQSTA